MEWEEIEKQSLIGKQLMIVDLIHAENDKAQKTGFSFDLLLAKFKSEND